MEVTLENRPPIDIEIENNPSPIDIEVNRVVSPFDIQLAPQEEINVDLQPNNSPIELRPESNSTPINLNITPTVVHGEVQTPMYLSDLADVSKAGGGVSGRENGAVLAFESDGQGGGTWKGTRAPSLQGYATTEDLEEGMATAVATAEQYADEKKSEVEQTIDSEIADVRADHVSDMTAVNRAVSQTNTRVHELETAISRITGFEIVIVQALPTPSLSTSGKMYLVPMASPLLQNLYDKYITILRNGAYIWERIGVPVDLSSYATKDELATDIASVSTYAEGVAAEAYAAGAADLAAATEILTGITTRIDNRLTTVGEELSARLDGVTGRIAQAEIDIDEDKGSIALLASTVDGIEGTVTDQGLRLSSAEGTINIHNNRLDTAEGSITVMEQEWDSIDATITTTVATQLATPDSTIKTGVETVVDGKAGSIVTTAVQTVTEDIDGILEESSSFSQVSQDTEAVKVTVGDATNGLVHDVAALEITATGLTSRITAALDDPDNPGTDLVVSQIKQTADEISEIVTNGDNYAAIIARLNEDTSSEVIISANKIYLTGQTIAEKILAGQGTTIAGWTFTSGGIANGNILLKSNGTIENRVVQAGQDDIVYWALNPNGSGSVAQGGIQWTGNGVISFAQDIKIGGLQSDITLGIISQLSFLKNVFEVRDAQGVVIPWSSVEQRIADIAYLGTTYNFYSTREVTAGGVGHSHDVSNVLYGLVDVSAVYDGDDPVAVRRYLGGSTDRAQAGDILMYDSSMTGKWSALQSGRDNSGQVISSRVGKVLTIGSTGIPEWADSQGGSGTVRSVKMNNGAPIQPDASGVVDLGTVITEHQSIKTINSVSLIGSGNITLATLGVQPTIDASHKLAYSLISDTPDLSDMATKTWVSGNYLAATLKGASNGLAELGSDGKVPSSQLPSYVDDVLEFSSKSAFPATGESGKIYVALDTNLTYRWSGTAYIEISPSLALGETSSTAYRGDRGKIAYDHSQQSGNPHNTTLAQIVGNADLAAKIIAMTSWFGKNENGVYVEKENGQAVNFFSYGEVTAGGVGSGGSGGTGALYTCADVTAYNNSMVGRDSTHPAQVGDLLAYDGTHWHAVVAPSTGVTAIKVNGGAAQTGEVSLTIPSAVTESTVSGWGFTKNTGTVTSVAVKMNGSTKGTVTASGTIDLGTVLTEHQSLAAYRTALAQDAIDSALELALSAGIASLDGRVKGIEDWLVAPSLDDLLVGSLGVKGKINLGGYDLTIDKTAAWDAKQDAISDLATIRSNASNGNTAYGWGNWASRMTNVESRATSLESRATAVEGRATTLEGYFSGGIAKRATADASGNVITTTYQTIAHTDKTELALSAGVAGVESRLASIEQWMRSMSADDLLVKVLNIVKILNIGGIDIKVNTNGEVEIAGNVRATGNITLTGNVVAYGEITAGA